MSMRKRCTSSNNRLTFANAHRFSGRQAPARRKVYAGHFNDVGSQERYVKSSLRT